MAQTTQQHVNAVDMLKKDHQTVTDLFGQCERAEASERRAIAPQSDDYKTRFGELKEAVLDHVSEEEELIFPAARLNLDVNALGEQMQQRRIALVSSMAA